MSDTDEISTDNIDQLAQEDEGGAGKKKASTKLIELAVESGVELFHTPDEDAYASATVHGTRHTWPINSKSFRSYLTEKFMKSEKSAPGSQALQDALNTLQAEAFITGECHPVYVRTAQVEDVIYVDIADSAHTIIKVTSDGWCAVTDAPVRFRRPKGMQALPFPERGGDIDELRQFLNVPKLEQWRLLIVWLVAAFFNKGPFTLLVLQGRQGAAKSTTAAAIRRVIDPNRADLRSPPRSDQELVISARNSKLMAFDNISYISAALSDALCRLATGGGFATRALYTDVDEIIVDACLPVIITGIDDAVTRSDLLDRSILLELPHIAVPQRRSEHEYWSAFDECSPRILGAIFDLLSGVLRNLPEARARMHERPRMADFAERGVAVEITLGWGPGTFKSAYDVNQASADDIAIENSLIGGLIRNMAVAGWEGTPTELLKRLEQLFDDDGGAPRHFTDPWPKPRLRPRGFPTTTKALKSHLTRLIPNLAEKGVLVLFSQTSGSGSKKIVTIKSAAQATAAVGGHLTQLPAPVGPSAPQFPVQFVASAPLAPAGAQLPELVPSATPGSPQLPAPVLFMPGSVQLVTPSAPSHQASFAPAVLMPTAPTGMPQPAAPAQLPAPIQFVPQRWNRTTGGWES